MVTSRPYGEARPSHGEGFDLLDIQPLTDAEIGQLSHHFFTGCYGQDEATSTKEVERFQRALSRAPESRALARTAFLLTMMLLVSRSRPLPDKRHLLYELCIENLLTALPERKAEEGALLQREEWRPDDSKERMRVVAALAFAVQSEGYHGYTRFTIVRKWEEMAGLLPASWTNFQRMGFLGWLTGPAGLLTDRADGTLVFAHLSFQEFLTAWHLNANVEGTEPRVHELGARLSDETWWETLRLWAALIEKQGRWRSCPIFEALLTYEGGTALVGTMLADGLGPDDRFEAWAVAFSEELANSWIYRDSLCAQAWASSRQEERKQSLARIFSERVLGTLWLGWYRFQRFSMEAGLGIDLPLPSNRLSHAIIAQIEGTGSVDEQRVAAGRVLCGGPPIWPVEPIEIGLLQAWPSFRKLAGTRLQLAASCGADWSAIKKLSAVFLNQPAERNLDFALEFAPLFAHYLVRRFLTLGRNFARDFILYFARYFAPYLPRDHDRSFYFIRDFADNLSRYYRPNFARDFARYLSRDFDRYFAGDFARNLAQHAEVGEAAWLFDYSAFETASLGRAGGRVQLSSAPEASDLLPLAILAEASKLSLRPKDKTEQFEESLTRLSPSIDPLWPALARHLARRSTEEDRVLLTDLAKHPERSKLPLSWGMQYIVRGDVMLEDGSVVTLDELADMVGLPHLSYLDEIPDEWEIDLELEE